MGIRTDIPRNSKQLNRRPVSWQKRTMVGCVGVFVTYALGLLATIYLSPKQDPYASTLSYAGTELVLLNRGRVLSKDQWFPSYECLFHACPETKQDVPMPYGAALSYASMRLISPGAGKAVCSLWIFEPLWRDGCIDISINAYELSANEWRLLLDFLQHPCRYKDAAITTSLARFECQGSVANKERKVAAFVRREPMSLKHPYPERMDLQTH